MRPNKTTVLALEIITAAAYVWYCWSVSRAVSNNSDDEFEIAYYNRIARVCQRVAGRVGTWGIEAEVKRDKLIERGRMV